MRVLAKLPSKLLFNFTYYEAMGHPREGGDLFGISKSTWIPASAGMSGWPRATSWDLRYFS